MRRYGGLEVWVSGRALIPFSILSTGEKEAQDTALDMKEV